MSVLVLGFGLVATTTAVAAPSGAVNETQAIAAHWTPALMAAAVSRDVSVDSRGRMRINGPGSAPSAMAATARTVAPSLPVVANAPWMRGHDVQESVGRLYFEMTIDGLVGGYVCSGTAVTDSVRGFSSILTAAHCVYDDYSGAFAKNVMFIPNQVASGTRTDLNCSNDIYGCWIPTQAAVDPLWSTVLWPDNLAYDYGFYLVPNSGRHVQGLRPTSDSLESAVHPLKIGWSAAEEKSQQTFALGYSWVDDPSLMFCAEPIGSIVGITDYTNLWLANCGLSGGSSGGPWMAPEEGTTLEGEERVFSVNSWGLEDEFGVSLPGMAGPVLQDPSRGTSRAHKLFNRLAALASSSDALIGPVATRF